MLCPQSHTSSYALQESDILYHCNSLKRNSQHPRSFWSLLISLSHPSHPSALPLTSLTASLNLSCTLFLHSFLWKTCSKTAEAREKQCSHRSASKDRGAMNRRGLNSSSSPPGQAPSNLWFSHCLFSTLAVSLWVISTLFLPLTIYSCGPVLCNVPTLSHLQFSRHCNFAKAQS